MLLTSVGGQLQVLEEIRRVRQVPIERAFLFLVAEVNECSLVCPLDDHTLELVKDDGQVG